MSTTLQIKLTKSVIGKPKKHRAVVAGLGLSKLNQTVVLADTPEVRGMVAKVSHLVNIVQ